MKTSNRRAKAVAHVRHVNMRTRTRREIFPDQPGAFGEAEVFDASALADRFIDRAPQFSDRSIPPGFSTFLLR